MKWMTNGTKSRKFFKTFLMCCMLGKYDASYPYLFCCSYETVETDFPICEIFIFILNLRSSNNETYQTLQISFLNYFLIIIVKLWDLCIIIIIVVINFSFFFSLSAQCQMIEKEIARMKHPCKCKDSLLTATYNSFVCLMNCAMSTIEFYKLCAR